MFLEEASKITQFISAFLLILFSGIILAQKRGKPKPRLFLSAFFLSRAFIILGFISYYYFEAVYRFPDLYVVGEPFLFLYAPFLFLYTRSVTRNNPGLRWYDIFHFIPFLAVALYFLLYFHLAPHGLKVSMLLNDELFNSFLVDGSMLWLQFGVYSLACIILMVHYRLRIEQFNSSYRHDLFNWLVFLVGAFILWKGIFVSGYLFGLFSGQLATAFKIFVEIAFLFYASMIAYKGLQMPNVVLSAGEGAAYQNSPLTADDRATMLQKLDRVMSDDRAWQDPELTLGQLAAMAGIPPYHLSQLLNTVIRRNFYNYVNSFRIEAAKVVLADPARQDMTILEVLYDVGFSSKSVFNAAFKKETGLTPTAYRKKLRREPAA